MVTALMLPNLIICSQEETAAKPQAAEVPTLQGDVVAPAAEQAPTTGEIMTRSRRHSHSAHRHSKSEEPENEKKDDKPTVAGAVIAGLEQFGDAIKPDKESKESLAAPIHTDPVIATEDVADNPQPITNNVLLPYLTLQDNSSNNKKGILGRVVALWRKIWPAAGFTCHAEEKLFEESQLHSQIKSSIVDLHNVFTPNNQLFKSMVNNNNTRGKTLTVLAAIFGCHRIYQTMDKELPFVIGFMQKILSTSKLKLGLAVTVGLATKFVVPRLLTYWQTKGIKLQFNQCLETIKSKLEPHKDKPGLREQVLNHSTKRRAQYESLVSYLLPQTPETAA
jgi:hypothetical protein